MHDRSVPQRQFYPKVLRFSFALAYRSCLPAGIILQVIISDSIVEDCSQLTVDCFQIRLRIAFSILILIHQQLILPCTYICHRNLTKNLFLKIWSDLQVNDITLCIHGVFTKSDIHILIVDFQKVPEFDIYTLALLLKKVSLPLFCLAFGPESTFLFSLLVTLPVFIIDLYFPVLSFFVNTHC